MTIRDMELIFVSNELANGGAGRVISSLADEFAASGVAVGIAIYKPHVKEFLTSPQVNKEYGPEGSGLLTKLKRLAWLRAIARRNPNAAFVTFEYFVNMQTLVALVGRSNGVVVSERNDPARVGAGGLRGLARERLYRRADVLVCQTGDAAAYFSDRITKRIILNPLKPGLPDAYTGERREAIVAFARLEPQKNLALLLRAFARFSEVYPSYELEIYGDGREEARLIALAEERGVAARVSIRPATLDVHDRVRDAAMFVLPSDYEGLSNSMLEALALGIPSICTDCPCGGARTVISHEVNGLLIPVGDEGALLSAMLRLASSAELRHRLSTNAMPIRERLSVKSISAQWMDVLSLVGPSRG